MFDARAIANAILDEAAARGFDCSNLKLQKLLYFTYGIWVLKYPEVLCNGSFEAWQHGPVHPIVYESFKKFGDKPITERAHKFDPRTRESCPLPAPNSVELSDIIRDVVKSLGHLSGSQLRNMTHAKGSPWDVVVQNSTNYANLGMQISDDVIRNNFGKQLILVHGEEGASGRDDIYENSPYS